MLQNLTVKNYALIESLEVNFTKGLSMITGETGAGKSILLGALGLILGKRADLNALKNKDQKCIIEASFNLQNYPLGNFFKEQDLDYEDLSFIRREILPSGKSRAFVNDTPVNLNTLQKLGVQLIDIHSQHETLQLAQEKFQFNLLDALGKNNKYIASYKRGLSLLKVAKKELQELIDLQEKEKQQFEYTNHLFEELAKADFKNGEQEELETNLDKLNNVEEIKLNLAAAFNGLNQEENGVLSQITQINSQLSNIANFSEIYKALSERINSLKIELEDIANELENENEQVEFNPANVEKYNDRLQLLYDLQKKHQVDSISALNTIKNNLDKKVQLVEQGTEIIDKKQKEVSKISAELDKLANTISSNRKKQIPLLIKHLEQLLAKVEMPYVTFKINLSSTDSYFSNGKDELEFLISVNKGTHFMPIKKGPSGGEMSRIMLAVKTLLSKHTNLPTIIFDEIDTGVSGEVATKIATIMQDMSKNMQVISISHLPQVAAKGNQHFKVFKHEVNHTIETNITALNQDQRIKEIAEMLGGKILTDSAITHAKQLLGI